MYRFFCTFALSNDIFMIKRFVSFLLLAIFVINPARSFNYNLTSSSLDFNLELNPFFLNDSNSDFSLSGVSETESKKPGLNKSAAIVLGTEAVLITGIMSSLYASWYSGSETGGFHFYNDNDEWLQMDKFGHANSCYNLANVGYEALSMAGMDEKHSILYGGPLGLSVLVLVEIFDGLSNDWGFSWGLWDSRLYGMNSV